MNNQCVTRSDVVKAAIESNIGILQAINMMQSACAKLGDEQMLSQLCSIKNEILFGDE